MAMYLIATSRTGLSSLQLSKELGTTQKTAWFLLHRIREGCTTGSDALLKGVLGVDETDMGGLEANKHKNENGPKEHGVEAPEPKRRWMRPRGGQVNVKSNTELQK